jgi:hypothetical protein
VGRLHLVVAGDSNGICQLFVVSENVESRRTEGRCIQIGSRPILSIDILPVRSRLLVLIGTTAGDILVWDLPSCTHDLLDQWDQLMNSEHLLGSYEAHQMGTNTISASILSSKDDGDISSTTVLICSGGDDQALCTCEATFSIRDKNLELNGGLNPQMFKEASSSAIKGVIQLKEEGAQDVRKIVSVGYSQLLAVWEYSKASGQLKLLNRSPVDVGDVNCLAANVDLNSNYNIAVGGSGVELFSYASGQ